MVHSFLNLPTVPIEHVDNLLPVEEQKNLSIADIVTAIEKKITGTDAQKVVGDIFAPTPGGSPVVIFLKKEKISKTPPPNIICAQTQKYYVLHSTLFSYWLKEEQQPKKVATYERRIAGMFTNWQPGFGSIKKTS